MAYDGIRQRLVLYGGMSNGGRQGDTWEWDDTNWYLRMPVSAGGPPAREGTAMAYDAPRQRVVLFGGITCPPPGFCGGSSETWEWDGTVWTQRNTVSRPPANGGHFFLGESMVFDAARQRLILFSQVGGTWEWDGSTWSQQNPIPSPSQRFTRLAYDAARQRVILFGGAANGSLLSDTWTTPASPATALAFGTGCGAPNLTLLPDQSALPILGFVAKATITNLPVPVAFCSLGWSSTTFGSASLPMPLGFLGLTGCDLLQSGDFGGAWWPTLLTGPDTADFRFSVPALGFLLGLHIYVQAWAIAPGANPAGLIVSNGVRWTFGDI